jgi:hypothetical protein
VFRLDIHSPWQEMVSDQADFFILLVYGSIVFLAFTSFVG